VTQEKTRLKFRVSAYDGVTAGGLPEPRWTEKWGVGLFDYEEFHVTDQLLKLPFQEATPKTVCIFSILDGGLSFRLVDGDRRAKVNGVDRRDALITTGDKIQIGETLTIEVALAPAKAKAKDSAPGPSLVAGASDIPRVDREDGPTLTFAPTGSHKSDQPGMISGRKHGSDLNPEPKDIDFSEYGVPPPVDPNEGPVIPPSPIFAEVSRSIEIQEPSFNALQRGPRLKRDATAIAPRPAGPMKGMEAQTKVELYDEKDKGYVIPPRPASLSAGPMKGMEPEGKVALSDGTTPPGGVRRPVSTSAGPMKGMEPEGKVELADGKKRGGVIPPRPASLSAGPMKGMEPEGKVTLSDGKTPPGGVRKPVSTSAGPMKGMEPEGKVELSDGKSPTGKSHSAGPMRGMEPDDKVELAESPHHTGRDRSIDERMDAMADLTTDSIKPLFADEADLGIQPTFGERILAAISKLLKRDDLDPPDELFGSEDHHSSKPWVPEGLTDPGFSRSPEKTPPPSKEAPQPWIPDFISAAARIRGRAFIFLFAAIGTLMIAVGVFRIHYRIAQMKTPEVIAEPSKVEDFPPSRGLPLSIIEDKVRQMRQPRRESRGL
jgi:hypothetical protein